MDESTLASKARDDSVTADRINQNLLSTLYENEQPHYVLLPSTGVYRDSPVRGDLSKTNDDWQIVVTNFRIILFRSSNYAERGEQIPLSGVDGIDYDDTGWGRPSAVIKTQDHSYSFLDPNSSEGFFARLGISKRSMINRERIEDIESYIESKSDTETPDIEESERGLEGLDSIWTYTLIDDIEIIASYGLDLDIFVGDPKLQISPSGLSFIEDLPFHNVKQTRIPHRDIDFDQISTTTQRDFSKENRSRYGTV